MRKIVVMRPHEWLRDAANARDFALTGDWLDAPQLGRARFVRAAPVRVPLGGSVISELTTSEFEGPEGHGYLLDVDVDDDDPDTAEAELRDAFGPDVEGVYANPELELFPTVCPQNLVGDHNDVTQALRLNALVGAGCVGTGVRVAVVDNGIDGAQVNVVGGWTPRPGAAPGTAQPGSHGTMCALDVVLSAPNCQIHDYPLLQSHGATWVAFLSDAIRSFAEVMAFVLQNPGPMVVTNSWGLFDRAGDAPVGHPQNYSANPRHPFNAITGSMAQAGIDVVFAAGNCGSTCPDGRCGPGDTGPGNSIHGANAHPDVITVGAITVNDDPLGYSSQGPGALGTDKPDLCGFSHFHYPGANPSDHTGTSAACPVVAGVLAALRSKTSARTIPPTQLKQALLNTARDPWASGWNGDTGHGIVDASATFATV